MSRDYGSPPPAKLVFILFFMSGALALVYQVVWSRIMTHVFGSTALAVGTVIAAFMAGMAIGSWLFGKLADRNENCLKLYAQVEMGIAITALLVHFALVTLGTAYPQFYSLVSGSAMLLGLLRFLLAFILVMMPTILMGATLPILTRLLASTTGKTGASLSSLYAINTLGAVVGVLATGFFLIGQLGIHAPVYLAVAGNLVIGAIAWLAAGRLDDADTAPPTARTETAASPLQFLTPHMYQFLLLGLGISGFTSFAYEIYWTRSLVFILGNSTYALTTMLSAFLTGIALGGWLIRFVMARPVDRVLVFGVVQVLLGVFSASALTLLFSVSDAQSLNHYVLGITAKPAQFLVSGYAVSFLVMLVPAILIGTTFPLVGSVGARNPAKTGATVGRIYAINTAGNVLGALLPGLFLISWLGIQKGILMMALLNVLLGMAIVLSRLRFRDHHAAWRVAVPALLILAIWAMVTAPLKFQFPSENEMENFHTLYYREGPLATTKVYEDPLRGEKHMSVDGIVIGGTGNAEFKQLLLAHLPKVLLDDVSSELTVGLGSGILAGESALHDRVSHITSVEIEPSVIAGAAWFDAENHAALERANIDVVSDDIGNFLRTTTEKYQVITADEKTADEFASNGFSYSLEYYRLLQDHLAPGGLVMQWVPTTLPPSQYRMVLNTFASSFEHIQLWYFMPAYRRGPFNTLLIGSNEPVEIDAPSIDRRLAEQTDAFASIRRYGLTSAMAILPHFIAADGDLREAVRDAGINSLDFPRYEFYFPWDYAIDREQHIVTNHSFLFELKRRTNSAFMNALELTAGDEIRLKQTLRAEFRYLFGFQRFLAGMSAQEAHQLFDATLAMAPWNDSLRARIYAQYAHIAATRRNPAERVRFQQKAQLLYPESSHDD